jgi:flagellar motor protein MotB
LNAIQIAQSQNADEYATERLARARQVYDQARAYPSNMSKEIVSLAREATQIAEDARAIAVKRAEAEKQATEKLDGQKAIHNQPSSSQAPPTSPVNKPAQVSAPNETTRARQPVAPSSTPASSAIEVDHGQFMRDDPQARANRARLLSTLPRALEVVDTGRGIVITVPEELATAPSLRANLEPVAAAIRPYKGLHIEVEGHTDAANSVDMTEREAERVSSALVNAGIPRDVISVRGYGNTRPRTSNSNPASRSQNRRVEIVIAGDAIGILPTWDRTYTVQPAQVRR